MHPSTGTENAYSAFAAFVYTGFYSFDDNESSHTLSERCVLHAEVYVLADYLGVDTLKEQSVVRMRRNLSKAIDYGGPWKDQAECWVQLYNIVNSRTLPRLASSAETQTSDRTTSKLIYVEYVRSSIDRRT